MFIQHKPWRHHLGPKKMATSRAAGKMPGALYSPAIAHVFRSLLRSGCPGAMRSPRFLGDPCIRALHFDPDEVRLPRPRAFALRFGMRILPSTWTTVSALVICSLSGLARTARVPAVYASQSPSRAHHARLALGRWPPPLPGGTLTRESR